STTSARWPEAPGTDAFKGQALGPRITGRRVRMPLGANVPPRRPAADASSFTSHPRTSAPGVAGCAVAHKQSRAWLFGKPAIRAPVWPAALRGEIKEEASAAGGG